MRSLEITAPKNSIAHEQIKPTAKKQLQVYLRIAIQKKDYAQALTLLNHLITKEPSNAKHYSNRALVYYHCHCWSKALGSYNQALAINPSNDQIYVGRAKCKTAMGNYQQAIADYDYAIGLNPRNIKARLNQGILFRALELYDDAIVCFGLALFVGSLQAQVYAERGRTYHLSNHWNCAIGDYQRALTIIQQSPNDSLAEQIHDWMAELLN